MSILIKNSCVSHCLELRTMSLGTYEKNECTIMQIELLWGQYSLEKVLTTWANQVFWT